MAIIHKIFQSNTLRRSDLASRLTINCISSHVNPAKVQNVQSVTIMDVFDDYALNSPVREEIYEYYPRAKKANLKSGGNYPYLSKYAEVNIHLKVHLGNIFRSKRMPENFTDLGFTGSPIKIQWNPL